MNKVLECGVYCHKCKLFIKDEALMEFECHCHGENFENAKIQLVTEGGKWSEK